MNFKSRFNIASFANSGAITSIPNAGVPNGPSHEEGGMSIVDNQSGETKAEVEGGERIFSVDDTQQIEEMAMNIIQLQGQGDVEQATQLATQLGMQIVDMLTAQNEAQSQQENALAQGTPVDSEYDMTNMEQPDGFIGRRGLKLVKLK